MASRDTALATHVGGAGYAAFATWVQVSLSQTFDTALHEPLPPDLLAILDAGVEDNATSVDARN